MFREGAPDIGVGMTGGEGQRAEMQPQPEEPVVPSDTIKKDGMTRRDFVKTSVAAAVGLTVLGKEAFAGPSGQQERKSRGRDRANTIEQDRPRANVRVEVVGLEGAGVSVQDTVRIFVADWVTKYHRVVRPDAPALKLEFGNVDVHMGKDSEAAGRTASEARQEAGNRAGAVISSIPGSNTTIGSRIRGVLEGAARRKVEDGAEKASRNATSYPKGQMNFPFTVRFSENQPDAKHGKTDEPDYLQTGIVTVLFERQGLSGRTPELVPTELLVDGRPIHLPRDAKFLGDPQNPQFKTMLAEWAVESAVAEALQTRTEEEWGMVKAVASYADAATEFPGSRISNSSSEAGAGKGGTQGKKEPERTSQERPRTQPRP
jgi:hypothetical protein